MTGTAFVRPLTMDVILVNWNAGEQLQRCVETLARTKLAEARIERVVVVDNGSTDGSAEGLNYPGLNLSVMRNEENRGFAAACNQGAKGSEAEYLLFLNPDTLLKEGSMDAAVRFMESEESRGIGICGIQLLDEEGRVQRSCSKFPRLGHFFSRMFGLARVSPEWFPDNFMSEWDHAESREVEVVTGAFFLVRRAVFEALGGFDEGFFVYLEDVDFCRRAAQAGWRSYYLASAQAYHKGGGCSEQAKAARLFYSLRSRILYGYKHFERAAATAAALGTLLIEPFTRLAWAAMRGSWDEMRETVKGYGMLYGWVWEEIWEREERRCRAKARPYKGEEGSGFLARGGE